MLSADGGGGTVPQDLPGTACRASGVFTCRDDDRFTLVEQDGALSAFSGYRFDGPDPDLGGSLAAAIHPDDLPGARDALALQLAAPGARVAVVESRIVAKDGAVKWVWMSAEPCVADGARCLRCVFHDATAQRALLDELAASESRYAYILSKTEDAVFEWDCTSGGLACSPLFERKFGRRLPSSGFPESMLGAGIVHPDDVSELGRRLADLVGGASDAMSCECRLQRADGAYRWVRMTATLLRDARGAATRAMGLISDIDEQKRSVQQARERALRDPLTDLYNQGATKAAIIRRLAASDGLAAFVFVDVDNFKGVNDTLGHRYGDAVLSDIAFHLRRLFSEDDIVGRIGGDEFAVFLDRVGSKDEVEERMEAVLGLFRRSFGERKGACAVSASIGIAYRPDDGATYQELFEKADRAMYAAKTRGKNRWCAYDAAMEGASSPRLLVSEDPGALAAPKTLRGNTVEYLFSILLENPDAERAIPILFDLVGRQFGCARISLCEKAARTEAFACTFEWCAANVPSLKEGRGRISCDELAQVDAGAAEAVAAGRPFLLEAASADEGVLAGRGVGSACVCPVQEGGATVAFVAFESTAPGALPEEDRRTLRLVSEAIVLFLMNRRKQEALERHQRFSDDLLKRVNAHVYGVDPATHRVAFVSGDAHVPANLAEGDLCYRALRGFDGPCPDCPILDLRDVGDRAVKVLYHPQSNRWSETAAAYLHPEAGGAAEGAKPLCIIISHDITAYVADERSAGEALQLIELRNQLDLYRTASRGGAFVARMDEGLTLLYGNDIFYEVHGYAPDELRERHGNRCAEYVHPEDLPEVRERLARAMAAGERSARWEMRVVTARGSVRWVLVMGTFETRGDDVVLNGFVTDTTETHELRERIERSEERYRIALRQTKVNVWEYDFASRSILVTESSSSQHGYHKRVENVPESLIADGHIDPVSVGDFRRLYARLRAGEPSVRADILTRRADGKGSWWERISYTTIYDAQGVPVRAVAVGEDVTRQKEMERAYRQELKMRASSEDGPPPAGAVPAGGE